MQDIPKFAEFKFTSYSQLKEDAEALQKYILTVDFNEKQLVKIENEHNKLYIVGELHKRCAIYDENFKLLHKFPENQVDMSVRTFNEYVFIRVDKNKSERVLIKNNEVLKGYIVQNDFIFIDDILINYGGVYKFTEKYYYFTKKTVYMYIKIADMGYIFEIPKTGDKSKLHFWYRSSYFTNIPEHMNEEILKNYVNLQLEQIKLADKLEAIDAEKFWKLPYNGNDINYLMKRIKLTAEDFDEADYIEEINLVKSLVEKGGISESLFNSIEKIFVA